MCLGLWGPDAAMLSPPERGAGGWNASPADFRAASEGLQRHLELIEKLGVKLELGCGTWSEIWSWFVELRVKIGAGLEDLERIWNKFVHLEQILE